jgi:hypothetical protein
MEDFKFGKYIIKTDVEKTKNFYNSYNGNCTDQIYRNYSEFCKSLNIEETEFFNKIGITPSLVSEIYSCGMNDDKTLEVLGIYNLNGYIIEKPNEVYVPMEEFLKGNFDTNELDTSFNIGRFSFNFRNYDVSDIVDNLNEHVIQLEFSVNIEWLLDEKYIDNSYKEPKRFDFIRKIKEYIKMKKINNYYMLEESNSIKDYLDNKGIKYIEYNKRQVINYKKKWFSKIVPDNIKSKAKKVCFPNNKFNNYLWHIFSYDYLDCIKNEEAKNEYINTNKDKVLILLDFHNLCFEIEDVNLIDFDFINSKQDIYITDINFNWCYINTHESCFGPYFYINNKE